MGIIVIASIALIIFISVSCFKIFRKKVDKEEQKIWFTILGVLFSGISLFDVAYLISNQKYITENIFKSIIGIGLMILIFIIAERLFFRKGYSKE